jgi:hypothetical protein
MKMAKLILEYNEQDAMAKKVINFILSLEIFKVKNAKATGLDKAILEEKQGKTTTYNNSDDFKNAMKTKIYV